MITPCQPWATESDLCVPCVDSAYENMSDYLVQASELLYQLSAQQFPGLCTETIAPCSSDWAAGAVVERYEPAITLSFRRALTLENPFPWGGCGCGYPARTCSCSSNDAIVLPRSDITEVTEVISDGIELYPDDYELQGNTLIRLDGLRWPCCDDTFAITYTYGVEPPASGVRAAAVLACELLLACEPDAIPGAKCRLPRNITSISRQGVSVIFDRLTNSGPFRFGIWEVDVFLEAFNPYGLTTTSTIMSPDSPTYRRIP